MNDPLLDARRDAERQLKAAPASVFVERRRALAAEARARGDKALARDIAALRKPSAAAAALNHLAIEAPSELIELLDLGAELRSAVAAGDELRPLLARRQALLDAVALLIDRRADDDGEPLSAAAQAQVSQTLRAVLADAAGADLLRDARLDVALPEPGFDAWPSGPPRATPSSAPTTDQADEDDSASAVESGPVVDPAMTKALLALERARAELDTRASALEAATRRRRSAEDEVARLDAELANARRLLEAATAAELEAVATHHSAEVAASDAAARLSAIESSTK